MQEIIQKLESVRVVLFKEDDGNGNVGSMFKIMGDDIKEKSVEYFLINRYFKMFIEEEHKNIITLIEKKIDYLDYEHNDTESDGAIRKELMRLFVDIYMKGQKNREFNNELNEYKYGIKNMSFFYPSSPFAIQKNDDNFDAKHIFILYAKEDSNIDSPENEEITKVQLYDFAKRKKAQPIDIVYINKISKSVMSILNFGAPAKESIHNGDGVAFLQTTDKNPIFKGGIEIKTF